MPQPALEPAHGHARLSVTLSRVALDLSADPREAIYEVSSEGRQVGRLVRRRATTRLRAADLNAKPWRAQQTNGGAWFDLDGWHPTRAAALAALIQHLASVDAS